MSDLMTGLVLALAFLTMVEGMTRLAFRSITGNWRGRRGETEASALTRQHSASAISPERSPTCSNLSVNPGSERP